MSRPIENWFCKRFNALVSMKAQGGYVRKKPDYKLRGARSTRSELLRMAKGDKELLNEVLLLATPGVQIDIQDAIKYIRAHNEEEYGELEKIKRKYSDINNNHHKKQARAYLRQQAIKEKALRLKAAKH